MAEHWYVTLLFRVVPPEGAPPIDHLERWLEPRLPMERAMHRDGCIYGGVTEVRVVPPEEDGDPFEGTVTDPGGAARVVQTAPSRTSEEALTFLRELAALTGEGELDPEGREYCWTNDDAWSTLQGLITDARALLQAACVCAQALGPLPDDPRCCARCGREILPGKLVVP